MSDQFFKPICAHTAHKNGRIFAFEHRFRRRICPHFIKNTAEIQKKGKKVCTLNKFVVPLHRFYGDSLAQQVEHIPFKDGVVGSNPTRITKGSSLTPSGDSFFMSIPIYHSATHFL